MEGCEEFLSLIRKRTAQRILFSAHAIRQMSRPDRMISTTEVRTVLAQGEIIEDYPEDARGHSCLMLGKGASSRPVHVICSPKDEYLAIITAYLPANDEWMDKFKVRKK
jgi:hypothetical protein